MTKNLIVCCDGTWNDPDELRDRIARPTNVAKLALTIASDVDEDTTGQPRQLVHYETGVGTSTDERLIGGGFGYGLSRNIRNGYRFLAEYYDPGDRVYLFGFSRGAYTARSLAGLIHNCGILRRECAGQVDAAFAFYRDRTNQTHPKTIASHLFREMYSYADSKVFFTGVWDTVGALGIPEQVPGWKELSKVLTGWEQMWGFHDTRLSPDVTFAYQALAIDEQRPRTSRPCGCRTRTQATSRRSNRSGSPACTARSAVERSTPRSRTSPFCGCSTRRARPGCA